MNFRIVVGLVIVSLAAFLAPATDGWESMFDGKTLDGWKALEAPENWKVENGAIVGRGGRSHLFWMKEECVDCEFKAEVSINDGGNSGMFFRARLMPGWPEGYEAQVNSTHRDPVKTGSLYNFVKIFDQLVPPDTWFTQHIIVVGNRITIKVNNKVVVDFVDEKNTYKRGYLALQQHHQGSEVRYRNLMFRRIQ
mgnify:CR=1 FL=1